MAYGHAERALATIRQLGAETRQLLLGLDELDPEQAQWPADAAARAGRRQALAASDGMAYEWAVDRRQATER